MAVRVQVVFEGETMEGVVAEVRRWLGAQSVGREPDQETEEARREREVRGVLGAIKGPDSRQFVRELAEAAVQGQGIPFDDALKGRFGKINGTAFAGIVGGPNKLMRRIANRDLIARDTVLGGYRLDPLDASVVLAAWPEDGSLRSPGSDPPAATSAAPSRPLGIPLDRALPRRG
jgi:hypothetical protein